MDLLTFLRARLDEDEAAARAATDGTGRWVWRGVDEMRAQALADESGGEDVLSPNGYEDPELWVSEAVRDHIARHDPARALAEVAAKRAIVDAFVQRNGEEHEVSGYHATGLGIALRHLAAAYAVHEDYREEWKY